VTLRILIASEKRDRLERLAAFIATLGHEVIAREIQVKEVAASTAHEHPDVALVGLGSSTDHALDLISEIVREAACPVIAILERRDPAKSKGNSPPVCRENLASAWVETTPRPHQHALACLNREWVRRFRRGGRDALEDLHGQ
jgi:chemotaxis response regulator CheB